MDMLSARILYLKKGYIMDVTKLYLPNGPFVVTDVFIYYDGCKTFAIESQEDANVVYVLNAIDEDEESGSVSFLTARMNADRYDSLRLGSIPFRSVFEDNVEPIYIVKHYHYGEKGNPEWEFETVSIDPLPDNWIPEPGLNL